MRLGKCPKCKNELYGGDMRWNNWVSAKCKCGFKKKLLSKNIIRTNKGTFLIV